MGTEAAHEFLTRLVADPSSPWWDDTTTPTVTETRNEVIGVALDKAAQDLKAGLGDPGKWTWGSIHTVTFQEQTLGTSGIGPLEWIFNKGPYAAPGSCTTVFKVCGSISDDWPTGDAKADLQERFAAGSSPSYRLVVDMKNLDQATIIQTTRTVGRPVRLALRRFHRALAGQRATAVAVDAGRNQPGDYADANAHALTFSRHTSGA